MKVFVSVPMHGRKLNEISDDIRGAVDVFIKWNEYFMKYTDEDIEFIDSLDQLGPEHPIKNKRVWYLSKAIERLADCDAVIFCHGWREAHGCKVERTVADEYGLDTFVVTSTEMGIKIEHTHK